MKRIYLILLITAIFFIIAGQVSACSINIAPYFYVTYIRTPALNNCYFIADDKIASDADVAEFIRSKTPHDANCENLVLTEKDKELFGNVINKFSDRESYPAARVYIENQSDEDYITFQEEAAKVNADNCDCKRFDDISRYENWTIYLISRNCPLDSACQLIPPEGCPNRLTYEIFWRNPLVFLLVYVVISIVLAAALFLLVRFAAEKFAKFLKK